MLRSFLFVLFGAGVHLSGFAGWGPAGSFLPDTPLVVRSCRDFKVNGKGDNAQWKKAPWTDLQKLDAGGAAYKSRFKILYSSRGIYVLFDGADETITSSFKKDFDPLFKGDVFEVFFDTAPAEPVYFEYEVSPLDKELVLLMMNRNDSISGWAPWAYRGGNKVEKRTHISGGAMKPGARIKGWTTELFFPYRLLSPLNEVPPVKGTRWNANFCRLDYDSGQMIKWAWAPVAGSFHERHRYYALLFE